MKAIWKLFFSLQLLLAICATTSGRAQSLDLTLLHINDVCQISPSAASVDFTN